jgi:hypothetical protein
MIRPAFFLAALSLTLGCDLLFGPPPVVLGEEGEGEEGEGEEGEGEEGEGEEGEGEGAGEGEGEGAGEGEGEAGEGEGEVVCTALFPTATTATIDALGPAVLQGQSASPPADLQIELYGAQDAGLTQPLGSGVNANYQSCGQCLRATFDGKSFFQSDGFMVLDSDPAVSNAIQGRVQSAQLVEVTIDDTFLSTPVPGGACLTIDSWTFDVAVAP